MTDAVIVSTARTGLGKSWKGAFNMTYGATLGAHSVRHAVARALRHIAESSGADREFWTPAPLLARLADQGTTFSAYKGSEK